MQLFTIRRLASAFLLLAAILPYASSKAEPIHILTEEWKPYSYTENGQLKGLSTEIVCAVFDRMGVDYRISVLPWARAYRTARLTPNKAIFAIVRTPERESLFHWIGQVAPTDRTAFYKLRSRTDIRPENLEEARQFRIGVNRDSDKHQFLEKHGFANLMLETDQKLSITQLLAGRVDLILQQDINLGELMRNMEIAPGRLQRTFTVFESRPFLAFSPGTAEDLVAAAKQAYQDLKKEGKISNFPEQEQP